jgi:hypothetical protein
MLCTEACFAHHRMLAADMALMSSGSMSSLASLDLLCHNLNTACSKPLVNKGTNAKAAHTAMMCSSVQLPPQFSVALTRPSLSQLGRLQQSPMSLRNQSHSQSNLLAMQLPLLVNNNNKVYARCLKTCNACGARQNVLARSSTGSSEGDDFMLMHPLHDGVSHHSGSHSQSHSQSSIHSVTSQVLQHSNFTHDCSACANNVCASCRRKSGYVANYILY